MGFFNIFFTRVQVDGTVTMYRLNLSFQNCAMYFDHEVRIMLSMFCSVETRSRKNLPATHYSGTTGTPKKMASGVKKRMFETTTGQAMKKNSPSCLGHLLGITTTQLHGDSFTNH